MSKLSEMMDSLSPARDEEGCTITQRQWDELRKQLAERDVEIKRLGAGWSEANDTLLSCRIDSIGLRDELQRQVAMLRPFAALLQDHNCNGPDTQPIFQINDAVITLGDLRRAVAATKDGMLP